MNTASAVEAEDDYGELDLELSEVFSPDLEGFEGPLHLLLALARTGKVDLKAISMAELADQYLIFINTAKALRLELAGDYLVMAAWLAQLKSRLLLPPKEREGEDEQLAPEELSRRLAFRLTRLEAMRQAVDDLKAGEVLGRDVFTRGAPEGIGARPSGQPTAELFDLLKAYGARRVAVARQHVRITPPLVYTLADARHRIMHGLPKSHDWRDLLSMLPADDLFAEPPPRASVLASAFAAGLELAKEGRAELRQDALFAPIFVRARDVSPVRDVTPKSVEARA